MRFHVVNLPHTQTTKYYSPRAYTQKVRRFCDMMSGLGHEVFLYTSQENEAAVTELITIATKDEQREWFGNNDFFEGPINITWGAKDQPLGGHQSPGHRRDRHTASRSAGWPSFVRKEQMLHDAKILMTGATGMVGQPIARELARTNEVWAVGRFGDTPVRATLEDAGVHTVRVDLTDTDLPALPDVDYQWGTRQ